MGGCAAVSDTAYSACRAPRRTRRTGAMIGAGVGEASMRRFALALLLAPAIAAAASLEGHVGLVVDGKPLRAEEAAGGVVYFRPTAPAAVKPLSAPVEMLTMRKQFVPRILPIVVGSVVRFPN